MLTNSKLISWLAETAIYPVSSVSQSQLWLVSSYLVSSVILTASPGEEHKHHPWTYRSQEGYIHPPANQEACPTFQWPEILAANSYRAIFCITGTSRRTPIRRQEDNRQDVEGIRHRHHPVCCEKSEAYFQFVNKSNEFITTTYPQTFSKDIDGKKADIIYELSSYTTERYVKPTLSGFQSSK